MTSNPAQNRLQRERKAAAAGRTLAPYAVWEVGKDGQRRNVRHLWSIVDRTNSDGCWLWLGSIKRDGYGLYAGRGPAHREVYRHLVGAIPEGLELDHLCYTPSCVNPEHLEPVTRLENARRAAERRTHCPHGHPWDEKNTRYTERGTRRCLGCSNYRQRVKRALQRVNPDGTRTRTRTLSSRPLGATTWGAPVAVGS